MFNSCVGETTMPSVADIEQMFAQGRFADAEVACLDLIDRLPTNPKGHAYLGLILFKKGAFHEAIPRLKTAISLDPEYVDAGLKLAQCYDRTHQREEAFTTAKEFLRIQPYNRMLQGIVHALQHQVIGNRVEGWEYTRGLSRAVIQANADED